MVRSAIVFIAAWCALMPVAAQGRSARASGGSAAIPDAAAEQRAQQALAAGEAAFAQGTLKLASDKAAESLRLAPSAEALRLLGRVALAEGRQLDAQDLLRRYLADPDLESDDQSPAQNEARRLTATLPTSSGQLKILGDAGTQVILDGRLVGVLPLPLPLLVAVGSHKVELVRGRVRLEDEVRVPLGRLAELRSDTGRSALITSVLPGVVLLDEYRGIDAAMEQRLNRAAESAVESEHLSLLPRELVLEAAGEPPPGPCLDEARCLMTLVERSQADFLLRLRVQRQAGPPSQPANDWQIELQLWDAETGMVAASNAQSCERCEIEKASRTLADMFAPVYKRAVARPRGRLELHSEPSGALVTIDGRKFGTTPLEMPLFAGSAKMTLKMEGYQDVTQDVAITEGEPTRLTLPLTAVPKPPPSLPPPPPPPQKGLPRPLWRLVTGSVVLAGGLLGIGIGAGALAVDGHCANPYSLSGPTDPPACLQKFVGTSVLGDVLLPIGGALVLGGTLLLALPKKTTAQRRY